MDYIICPEKKNTPMVWFQICAISPVKHGFCGCFISTGGKGLGKGYGIMWPLNLLSEADVMNHRHRWVLGGTS